MQIHGTHQIHGAQGLQGPHSVRPQQQVGTGAAQPTDQIDISPAARAASDATQVDGVRTDLVAQLRTEIASGNYETADKLEQAVDRLFDALG